MERTRRPRFRERTQTPSGELILCVAHSFFGGVNSQKAVSVVAITFVAVTFSASDDPLSAARRIDTVENFKLLDESGLMHELYYASPAKFVVLLAHSTRCSAEFNEMVADIASVASDGFAVQVLGINSDARDNRASIRQQSDRLGASVHASQHRRGGAGVPILLDEAQIVGPALGFVNGGDHLVVRTADWGAVFRGSGSSGSRALNTALIQLASGRNQVSDGNNVEPPARGPCLLDTPSYGAGQSIDYVEDIAPLLIEKCVPCHRAGGIAPFAMNGWKVVFGFAPMIREVLRTRRMPPWHADREYGVFSNDRSLTAAETRTLVHWIESGAKWDGGSRDPLEEPRPPQPRWSLGEPDVVLEIPPFEVPASGVVEYKYHEIANPFARDVWVRATEFVSGDPAAVHHVLVSTGATHFGANLGGYAPGHQALECPEDTGVLARSDDYISTQIHYTPYGKRSVDNSLLGIYLHEKKPLHRLRVAVVVNTSIDIPANDEWHRDSARRVFHRPVVLYSVLPHMHYRGEAAEVRAVYRDGREEILLSVPHFDFNWQTNYVFGEPKFLPAGTTVVQTSWWDNSAKNLGNPEPHRAVRWGFQSWDEMLASWITFRYVND